jgi:dienelactone hydrolase
MRETRRFKLKKRHMAGIFFVIVLVAAYFYLNSGTHVYVSQDIEPGEPVRFQSHSLTISGSLIRPDTKDPTPAIIMIEGAGANSYRKHWREDLPFPSQWKPIAETFVKQGYSVLLLDKRGINYSEGHWEQADFYDRADDVYAAVQYLKKRTDIKADKIGLLGYSQGGWIAQLVAAQHPQEVAFIITPVTPATSVKEQVLYERESKLYCDGLSPEEIAQKMPFWRQMYTYYENFSKYIKTGFLSRVIDYDPETIIQQIDVPVYAIYGGTDPWVEAKTNAQLLEELLKKGGNDNYFIEIIPDAHHFMMKLDRCATHSDLEKLDGLHPRFLELLAGFTQWYDRLDK